MLNFSHSQVTLSPILTSLHYPLIPRLVGQVDVLVYNPPYVPTEADEAAEGQDNANIHAAWAGGAIGMDSTTELLRAAPVNLMETDPDRIKRLTHF